MISNMSDYNLHVCNDEIVSGEEKEQQENQEDQEQQDQDIQYSCGGQCANIKHDKHGRDGKDGKDGRDGKEGPRGPRGSQGPQGEQGPQGQQGDIGISIPQGVGLFNTSTYSFVSNTGIAGITYNDSMEILNIMNRKYLPITYIGIIWSTSDTSSQFTINLTDVSNKIILPLSIGPSKINNVKNVYEIFPSPSISTSFTRLIKFCLFMNPTTASVTFYSIMVGCN